MTAMKLTLTDTEKQDEARQTPIASKSLYAKPFRNFQPYRLYASLCSSASLTFLDGESVDVISYRSATTAVPIIPWKSVDSPKSKEVGLTGGNCASMCHSFLTLQAEKLDFPYLSMTFLLISKMNVPKFTANNPNFPAPHVFKAHWIIWQIKRLHKSHILWQRDGS